jgi:formylglycine-generating enzyme required for sulfatase activity
VAARRGVSPARLYREVRGDLEWIVLQALAPEREQRYAGVSELAADLRRHLADEPVVAGPPTLRYVLGKFLRRHRALVAGGALFLAVLLGALALTGAAFGRARDHLAAFDSLADLDLLEEVRRQAAEDLWPETPGQVPRMDDWLERARGLAARLPAYESAILDLRRRRGLAVDSGWRFPRFRDELLHRSLVRLVQELRRLAGPGGEIGSVAARREWARMLRERSIEAHRATWDRAIAAIRDREASPRYEGLVLPELPGFVPIGADPRTGLWELAFPRPGEELPRRDESGRLRIDERSCLVFVLVPGGTFTLGAQRQDPDGASHDPLAFRNEAPPHSVTLDPFLISKYEMTQAQWLRATGHNPSLFHPAYDKELDVPATLTHPVERVSWLEADETLRRLGLELPTEARWEYAARAGTTWAWWTGPDQKSLAGAVNLADAHARKAGFPAQVYDHWLDDGFTVHAPVDALRPNPFGLHHVLGNVWEWCRDPSRMYGQAAPAPGDGLREGPGDPQRIFRGGSYNMPARFARCSVRHQLEPSGSSAGVGVRPCRGLAP